MQASQLPLFFQHLETELAQAPNEIRRLFHGRGRRFEGLEQITCDWLQGQLIINLFKEVDDAFLAELKSSLNALAQSQLWANKQGRTMVLQHRYADGAPSEVLVGELDARPVVEESGLKYQWILAAIKTSVCFWTCATVVIGFAKMRSIKTCSTCLLTRVAFLSLPLRVAQIKWLTSTWQKRRCLKVVRTTS